VQSVTVGFPKREVKSGRFGSTEGVFRSPSQIKRVASRALRGRVADDMFIDSSAQRELR
jgi:hypothetical protein